MKRRIAFGLLMIMCFAIFMSANAEVDLSKMSKEELLDLRVQINARLNELSGESIIILDSKEVKIQWKDVIVNNFGYIQNSMIITNKTKKPIYFSISKVAYNGFQITMTNQGISFEAIDPDMSYLTSSAFEFLIEKSSLEAVGINDIRDINDVSFEISFYKDNNFSSKPFKTEKIRLSLPL